MQVSDVFSAQPKSVWEYLCEKGQGLYIPAYQRQYSWDKSKVDRLLQDIKSGYKTLISHQDAITFLGTVIAIHDTQYATVNPVVKPQMPARVMTIIDGQQRLTTLLLVVSVLNEEVRSRYKAVDPNKDHQSQWLFEESMKVCADLAKTFEEDKDYGDSNFRFYPKMIRAYDDSWSRKKDTAKYSSPIGFYLHEYGAHARSNNGKEFKFDFSGFGADEKKFKVLTDAHKAIKSFLRAFSKDSIESSSEEIPNALEIASSNHFQEMLVNSSFPNEVVDFLRSDKVDLNFLELLQIVLFSNFVLKRVALTIVTAKNEDYAFDMFESLNTTGAPLTSFETFKPRVIECEGLIDYEKSDSFKKMQEIESYLEGFTKSDEKQDATSRLVVSFALAESGLKQTKRLSDQRRYFKESFDKLDKQEKIRYIDNLYHTTVFIKNAWPDNKLVQPVIPNTPLGYNMDEVYLCLDFLRSIKHVVTIPILARFFSKIVASSGSGTCSVHDLEEFERAVKAVTAFSVLWRTSRRTTENIDNQYRKIMELGCQELGISGFSRRASDKAESDISSENLIRSLKSIIIKDGGISDLNSWKKNAVRLPIYSIQKDITRFVLLAATHETVEDPISEGLLIRGRSGIAPLFNLKTWRDANSQTVEHVAPQTPSGGWSDSLYGAEQIIDCFGNLTLLPKSENSSIGNSSWLKKRLFYKLLSASSEQDIQILLETAKAEKLVFSPTTQFLINKSSYLHMVKAISLVENEWNAELVDSRSNRILELAWDVFAPWLDL